MASVAAFCLLLLCGCGGSSSTTSNPSPTPIPSPAPGGQPTPGGQQTGGGTTNPQGQLITPTPVSVASGVMTSSVDIAVPVTTPPLNAQDLGANSVSASSSSAFNTGGTVARGSSALILMFGMGLNGSLTIRISGAQDISISNIQNVTSTDSTPGVAFVVTVPRDAATGARTVTLSDSQGNATTFTGGLEVI